MNNNLISHLFDDIVYYIERCMDTDDAVAIHNAYCEATNNTEDMACEMEDFNFNMNAATPLDIAEWVSNGGHFNRDDDYYYDTPYGVRSFDHIYDFGVFYASRIADYIIENNDDLGFPEIREIMDKYNALLSAGH